VREGGAAETVSATPPRRPPSAETRAQDAALAEALDRKIDGGEFSQARWGVAVVSLRDGRTVYARDAERLSRRPP
jgi:hypothetical protein